MADGPEVKVQERDETLGLTGDSNTGIGGVASKMDSEKPTKTMEAEERPEAEEPSEAMQPPSEDKPSQGQGDGEEKEAPPPAEDEADKKDESRKEAPQPAKEEAKEKGREGQKDDKEGASKSSSKRRESRGSRSRSRERRDRDRHRDGSKKERREGSSGRSSRRSRSRSRSRGGSSSRKDRHHHGGSSSSRSKRDRSPRASSSRSHSRDRKRSSRSHRKRRDRSPSTSSSSSSSSSSSRSRSPPPISRRKDSGGAASKWDKQPDGTPAPVPAPLQQPMQHMQQPGGIPSLPLNPAALAGFGGPSAATAAGLGLAANLIGSLIQASGGVGGPPASLLAPPAPTMYNGVAVAPQVLRQAKRLYIGNVPLGANEASLMALFNHAMVSAGKGQAASPPVVAVQMDPNKSFAFIELRSPEDAMNALGFDGIAYGANFLKVRRPKDYKPLPGMPPDPVPGRGPVVRGVVSTNVADSENKIYLGGIPAALNELQVRELVGAFGELKGFNLVKDANTNLSKGYAFFEYLDPSVTDRVCAELNNFELGGRKLTCQRANTQQPRDPLAGLIGYNPLTMGIFPGTAAALGYPMQAAAAGPPAGPVTKVIKLSNMILAEELADDTEYQEIISDVKEEAAKHGTVVSVQIPRPLKLDNGQVLQGPGVGQVYIEFANLEGAISSEAALRNRQFSGRTVIVSFYPEADYAQQNFH